MTFIWLLMTWIQWFWKNLWEINRSIFNVPYRCISNWVVNRILFVTIPYWSNSFYLCYCYYYWYYIITIAMRTPVISWYTVHKKLKYYNMKWEVQLITIEFHNRYRLSRAVKGLDTPNTYPKNSISTPKNNYSIVCAWHSEVECRSRSSSVASPLEPRSVCTHSHSLNLNWHLLVL